MKNILLLFLIISNLTFSQKKDLVGNWISENNEMIAISAYNKDEKQTLTNSKLKNEKFYLEILNDTLSFQDKYYSSSENYEKLHIIQYNLKILKLTDSILIVKPVSRASKKFFNTSNSIKFINQSLLKNDNFKFEKLTFEGSGIQLRINNKREIEFNALFYNQKGMQIDEAKSGSYYGKLDENLYSELIDLIIKSKIESLNITNEILCCDGIIKTIEVYHNGKRNYVKTMFEPRMLQELIEFLSSLKKEYSELTRTNQHFKF